MIKSMNISIMFKRMAFESKTHQLLSFKTPSFLDDLIETTLTNRGLDIAL